MHQGVYLTSALRCLSCPQNVASVIENLTPISRSLKVLVLNKISSSVHKPNSFGLNDNVIIIDYFTDDKSRVERHGSFFSFHFFPPFVKICSVIDYVFVR